MPSKEHRSRLYSAPIIECSKHTAADVMAKAQAVLSEPKLHWAMCPRDQPADRFAGGRESWRGALMNS